ncbi:MAG: hypothetical protein Kow0097_12090 [Candidatus Bipolaricaulota bacterium]|nr:hypothetical protein [Candidatus Bipolaricaulota bacterium]
MTRGKRVPVLTVRGGLVAVGTCAGQGQFRARVPQLVEAGAILPPLHARRALPEVFPPVFLLRAGRLASRPWGESGPCCVLSPRGGTGTGTMDKPTALLLAHVVAPGGGGGGGAGETPPPGEAGPR